MKARAWQGGKATKKGRAPPSFGHRPGLASALLADLTVEQRMVLLSLHRVSLELLDAASFKDAVAVIAAGEPKAPARVAAGLEAAAGDWEPEAAARVATSLAQTLGVLRGK